MTPVTRPETQLYCHNPDCGYADESWRFSAFGGDDVTYKCPKCKSTAQMFALKKTAPEVEETIIKKEPEMTRRQMNFIVVDLENRTLKVIPEERVKDEGDNVDLLLPMVTADEASRFQRRAARDFDSNLSQLIEELQEGTLPYDASIDMWLQDLGVNIYEAPHNDALHGENESEIELGDEEDFDEDELGFQGPAHGRHMPVDGSVFVAGFQTGVSFALNNLHLFMPQQPLPEETRMREPVEPLPTKPLTPRAAVTKDRAVKLLRMIKAKKQPAPAPVRIPHPKARPTK